MDFTVESKDGLFVGTTSGEATADALGTFWDAVFSHEEWKPGSPFLHDISNLDCSSLREIDIRRIAAFAFEHRDLFGESKIAIVAVSDLEFGFARMLSVFVNEKLDFEFVVFRSRNEAFEWLAK